MSPTTLGASALDAVSPTSLGLADASMNPTAVVTPKVYQWSDDGDPEDLFGLAAALPTAISVTIYVGAMHRSGVETLVTRSETRLSQ